jgi:hypothetical protein
MTVHSRTVRMISALCFAALSAAPLLAASKPRQRAVVPPKTAKITVSGTVTDASTGTPLKGATITSAGVSTVSDDQGHYTLGATLTSEITATRVGYLPVKKSVSGATIDFALPLGPAVTVKTTSGQTIILDYDSTKFGYADVLQNVSGDGLNLCTSAGEKSTPLKNEFAKITGPAHAVSGTACCDNHSVQALNVQLKSGDLGTVYLADSCIGLIFDILGLERSSATAKYIHFTDVSEVDFP